MWILFDGLDLGGKTSIAQEVARRLGARYNAGGLVDGCWARFGRGVFASRLPNIVKGAVFTGSFLIDAPRCRPAREEDVVQDRYWPSLMAYAKASYPRLVSALITAPARWYVRFDVNVHVTCSLEERRTRLRSRGNEDRIDRSVLRDRGFAERYEREIEDVMSGLPNYLRLDTTGRTVEESVAAALSHIEACGGR